MGGDFRSFAAKHRVQAAAGLLVAGESFVAAAFVSVFVAVSPEVAGALDALDVPSSFFAAGFADE
jgi:hypothetical protein